MDNTSSFTPIEKMANDLIRIFIDAGYAPGGLQVKRDLLSQIVKRHHTLGYTEYSQSVIDDYINTANWRKDVAGQNVNYTRQMIRCAKYLQEYHESGTIQVGKKKFVSDGLSSYYRKILEAIDAHPSWSHTRKNTLRSQGQLYFSWLEEKGIQTLDDMPTKSITSFLSEKKLRNSSITTYKTGLSALFRYLYEEGIIKRDPHEAFDFNVSALLTADKKRERRPSPRSDEEEKQKIIECVDTTNARGKRDLAILLLGSEEGLTLTQISSLTLSCVKREGDRLFLRLTGSAEKEIPLSVRLSHALTDYIDNARPSSDDPHLFLTLRSPLKGIAPISCANVLLYYRKKAGLPPAPFSSLYAPNR